MHFIRSIASNHDSRQPHGGVVMQSALLWQPDSGLFWHSALYHDSNLGGHSEFMLQCHCAVLMIPICAKSYAILWYSNPALRLNSLIMMSFASNGLTRFLYTQIDKWYVQVYLWVKTPIFAAAYICIILWLCIISRQWQYHKVLLDHVLKSNNKRVYIQQIELLPDNVVISQTAWKNRILYYEL